MAFMQQAGPGDRSVRESEIHGGCGRGQRLPARRGGIPRRSHGKGFVERGYGVSASLPEAADSRFRSGLAIA